MVKVIDPFQGNMNVKSVLNRNHINQTELCKKLDFSREAFSKVVNGHRALSVVKAKLIADEYNLDWRDFFETPGDRYKAIDGCIQNLIVEKTKQNYFIVAPKEWHNNSNFYLITHKYGQWNEHVYVFEKQTHQFNYKLLDDGFALYTFKDGTQYIGAFDGFEDPDGHNFIINNCETVTWKALSTKKVLHIQLARALLTPNKK